MDIKHKKEMKKAIQKTIGQHQFCINLKLHYLHYPSPCPLCLFDKKYGNDDCCICPWTIFQKEVCQVSSENYYDNEASIKRLNDWLERLENE